MTMDVKVEEYIDELGELRMRVESDKFTKPFQIVKSPGGFVFFEIKSGQGLLPKELEGRYTRASDALAHLKNYISRTEMTKAAKRNQTYEKNHAKPKRQGD